MTRYPLWKHLVVAVFVAAAVVYALPNVYSKSPTVQVRALAGDGNADTVAAIKSALQKADIAVKSIAAKGDIIEAVFADTNGQIAARAAISEQLGGDYIAALNNTSDAPDWLKNIRATPLALGLDLRGGVYFLLQVDTDFALQKPLKGIVGELRDAFADFNVQNVELQNGAIAIECPDLACAIAALDLMTAKFPNLSVAEEPSLLMRATLTEEAADEIVELTMQQNLQTMRNRVNELGVSEPVITRQGKDRIAVQLPGVQDTAQAKKILGRTAALELRGVDETKTASAALIRRAKKGRPPRGTALFYTRDGAPLLLKEREVLSGDSITDARPGRDQSNQPAVYISLDSAGAEKIKNYTRPRVGQRIAILLTDRGGAEVISAPVVQQELYANFQITGGKMDIREASELALLLRAGALAAPIEVVEERTVGPSLGADNIRRGINSVIGGFIAIAIFIAAYYALFGLISVTALFANLVLLTALLGSVGATLTLPGLAGFALTLGMAIDANVLINERIREESDGGKTPLAAINAGYARAWTTILDSNITTLIAGVALFAFGSGPVRGFAVVLCFGILTSMFSSIQGSRSLVNLAIERGDKPRKLSLGSRLLSIKKVLPLMRWHKITAAISALFLLICLSSLAVRGLNFGIDFTGGTIIETAFANPPKTETVRAAMAKLGLENAPIQQSDDGLLLIKAPPGERGANLSSDVFSALQSLDASAELRRIEFVGPQVSAELFLAGALAMVFVLLGIAAYLSLRFKWRMAIGAIVANLHDIIFILGLFSLFQWEFNLPVLAATLAILGYSVNESVVIFDRVRENFRNQRRADGTAETLNTAISQTWSRTVITHGSTQLAVLAMLFFGGDALFLFALALTIGIFSSIYSSVLIAGPLAMHLGLVRDDFIEPADVRAENAAGAVV